MLEQPLGFLPLLLLLRQLVQVHGDGHLVRRANLDHGVPLPLAQPLNQFLGGLAYHPGGPQLVTGHGDSDCLLLAGAVVVSHHGELPQGQVDLVRHAVYTPFK